MLKDLPLQPDVLLIGSGNVATHLARVFKLAGISFELTSRNPTTLHSLAEEVGVNSLDIEEIPNYYSLAIIAVQDEQIIPAAALLKGRSKSIVHTSGTIPSHVLAEFADQYGVFYPLQTFRKEIPTQWDAIPICIYGSKTALEDSLFKLAKSLTPLVYRIDDVQRSHLHIAAVIVNNFVNHLAVKASHYCREHHVDFSILHPLIRQTAERIISIKDISSLQTGPAIRGDMKIVQDHITKIMESGDESLAEIYTVITRSILQNITD